MASLASGCSSLDSFQPQSKRQRRVVPSSDGPEAARAPPAAPPPAESREERSESVEEGGTVQKTSLWDDAVKTELDRYATQGENGTGGYAPGPLSKKQLRKAAEEFVKRCSETDEEDTTNESPYVLVSQNCQDMPGREFELEAIKSTGISKLWYALTKDKDLLIIKFASDDTSDTHADAVSELGGVVGNFAVQFGTPMHRIFSYGGDGKKVLLFQTQVAPDALLNRNFPEQSPPVDLRAPFIAELECEHRGPKALMEQLSTYLMQPVADYVLGIKVYRRSGPPVAAPGKRPFAAVALLWRRGPRGALPPGSRAQLVLARSFGTCELSPQSKNAFCTQRGSLQQVQLNQLDHPANHTAATDIITIPKAHLVQGAVDEAGNQVHAVQTDQDLTISLEELRGLFNMKLPA